MASFASSATTDGARKHVWTNSINQFICFYCKICLLFAWIKFKFRNGCVSCVCVCLPLMPRPLKHSSLSFHLCFLLLNIPFYQLRSLVCVSLVDNFTLVFTLNFRRGTLLCMSLFPCLRTCERMYVTLFYRSKIEFNKPLPRQIYYCLWHQCCGLFCLFALWPVSPKN